MLLEFSNPPMVMVFKRALTESEIKLLSDRPLRIFFSAWRRNRYHWLKTKR